LILGGTTEARLLSESLAVDARFRALLSFAGRTQSLRAPETPHRVGGFGGSEGLARFLRDDGVDVLIDATHPFAAQISSNAVHAARATALPLLRVVRPAWQARAGDRFVLVASMAEAAQVLGTTPRRVFLSIGRLEVAAFSAAPQHDYLIRAIDPFDPPLPNARVLCARGPFTVQAEHALFVQERIEVLVSKNAGSEATSAKLRAARALGLPVIMVDRPLLPCADEVSSLEDALTWLTQRHDEALNRRGA
jgi:precorrin-6A/cobalt-precorrin-6A reductase